MIALWMLYATAVGGLVVLAGALAERAARDAGRAGRFVWTAAIALCLALPSLAFTGVARGWTRVRSAAVSAGPATTTRAAASRPATATEPPPVIESAAAAATPEPISVRYALALRALDRPLLAIWVTASAMTAMLLLLAGAQLSGRRREWLAADVDGTAVLVARDLGPAVVGFFRPRIVMPAWALDYDDAARALIVAHEREHVRARDAWLLSAAVGAIVLCPWNAALWIARRRLQLAVELDCDARVLRARPDVESYGMLLLDVGRRVSRPLIAAACLAEGPRQLERRIVVMTERVSRRSRTRLVLSGASATAVLLAACATPHPARTRGVSPELYAQVTAIVDSQLRERDRDRDVAPRLHRLLDSAATDSTGRVSAELYDHLTRMIDSLDEQLSRMTDTLNRRNRPYGGRQLYHLLESAAADMRSRLDARPDSVPLDRVLGETLERLRAGIDGDADTLPRDFFAAPRSRAALGDGASYARVGSDSAVAVDGGCGMNASVVPPRLLVILVPPGAGAGEVHLRRLTSASAASAGIDGMERGGVVIRTHGDAADGDVVRCWSSVSPWRARVSAVAFARPDARLYLVSDEPVAVLVREPGGRTIVASADLDARVDSATFRWAAGGRNGAMTGWGAR